MPLSAPEWPIDGDGITAASFHFQFPTKVTQYILASCRGWAWMLDWTWSQLERKSQPHNPHRGHIAWCQCSAIENSTTLPTPTRTVVSGPTAMPSKLGSLTFRCHVIWRQKYLCWRRSVRGCDADWAEQGNGSLLPPILEVYFPTCPQEATKSQRQTWERKVLLRSSGPNTRLNWVKASVSTWKILVVGAQIYLVLQCPRQASYVPPLAY